VTLVDTSVWIDLFRGGGSPEAEWLEHALSSDEDLCTCGIILTEVLQGIRSARQYRQVKRLFGAMLYLPTPKQAHIRAADIYRAAWSKGKTIRNTVDCIIAGCALVNRVPLLHQDRDFRTIAAVSPLTLVEV